MDDGDPVRVLRGEEIAPDRPAHGYAITVHRSQGGTVERTHALEDGVGRELAYVKMSRATDRSTVYVVADSVEQAAEDLRREWKAERRLTWAIDRSPAIGRAGHPATARRIDHIEREVETLNVVADHPGPEVAAGRGDSRDRPWPRRTPVVDRGLDLGLGR